MPLDPTAINRIADECAALGARMDAAERADADTHESLKAQAFKLNAQYMALYKKRPNLTTQEEKQLEAIWREEVVVNKKLANLINNGKPFRS